MVAAEQVTGSISYHGEGAVWHTGWGGLKIVDMLAGAVLSLDETTGTVSRQEVGSPVAAAVRPRVGDGFVVATEREFALLGPAGRDWTSPALWDGPVRFNEGQLRPAGTLPLRHHVLRAGARRRRDVAAQPARGPPSASSAASPCPTDSDSTTVAGAPTTWTPRPGGAAPCWPAPCNLPTPGPPACSRPRSLRQDQARRSRSSPGSVGVRTGTTSVSGPAAGGGAAPAGGRHRPPGSSPRRRTPTRPGHRCWPAHHARFPRRRPSPTPGQRQPTCCRPSRRRWP